MLFKKTDKLIADHQIGLHLVIHLRTLEVIWSSEQAYVVDA